MKAQRWTVDRWTVDYGDGKEPVKVPHSWGQDLDVRSEGPAVYRVKLNLPPQPAYLCFHGVSYAAEVSIDGELRATHRGIWDSFDVPLGDKVNQQVDVEVKVWKNGGPTYPVPQVASGFLPYVFNTFGGLFREVELVLESSPRPAPFERTKRYLQYEAKFFIDGKNFYPRGLLHWGWYPELGHPHPTDDMIHREAKNIKELGFNLVKFCLWVPSHRHLEILSEHDIEAWLELPIWLPSESAQHQEQMLLEVEAIVRQYRNHENILFWSIGCEIGSRMTSETRQRLFAVVKNLTGSWNVGDSSGGAEMYGGSLREYGDFLDFHPYCDLPFYPPVLDSLQSGARSMKPVLLGEFNDVDVHRDLARVHDEMPFWASSMAELNDRGLRDTNDLPSLISSSRLVQDVEGNKRLLDSSTKKAAFQRKMTQEWVRSGRGLSGYVVTGWRDTPISTSGFFDDWGSSRFTPEETSVWNGKDCLFLLPHRAPFWKAGGNRVGWSDPLNVFEGEVLWRVGVHSELGCTGGLLWKVRTEGGAVVCAGGSEFVSPIGCEAIEVGEILWDQAKPGDYVLESEFGGAANAWPITVVRPLDLLDFRDWSCHDPKGIAPELALSGSTHRVHFGMPNVFEGSGIAFLLDEGTLPLPFWREAGYEFIDGDFWSTVPFAERWSRLLPVSPDRVIDEAALVLPDGASVTTLLNRIDMRSYAEAPVVLRVELASGGTWLVTTLRPYGGLGAQPSSLAANPAGVLLLTTLVETFR